MQNGYIESFNGKFRDGCLKENWFVSLADARHTIAPWRQHYNQERPHWALGYRTLQEFAQQIAAGACCGKDAGCARWENAPRFPLSPSPAGHQPKPNAPQSVPHPLVVSFMTGPKTGGRSIKRPKKEVAITSCGWGHPCNFRDLRAGEGELEVLARATSQLIQSR